MLNRHNKDDPMITGYSVNVSNGSVRGTKTNSCSTM